MSSVRAIFLVLLAAVLPACPSQGGEFDNDTCAEPGAASVSTLELGGGQSGPFEPWHDGDAISLLYGPQGGTMIASRIRASGSTLGCMMQKTVITSPGGLVFRDEEVPLRMYPQDGDSFVSNPYFVELYDGEPSSQMMVMVTTTAGSASASRALWIDQEYTGPGIVMLSPASIQLAPGQLSSLTLTLAGPAEQDIDIRLSSDSYGRAYPARSRQTIRRGEDTLVIEILAGQETGSAMIIAELGGGSKATAVTVTPPGQPRSALPRPPLLRLRNPR